MHVSFVHLVPIALVEHLLKIVMLDTIALKNHLFQHQMWIMLKWVAFVRNNTTVLQETVNP